MNNQTRVNTNQAVAVSRMRRRQCAALFAIAAACVFAALFASRSSEPRLIDHAVRVPIVPADVWLYWLTDHELVYPVKDGANSHIYRLNVDTGARDPVTILPANVHLFDLVGSPDGKRLTWMFHDSTRLGLIVSTAKLDGGEHHEWACEPDAELCWSSDSRYAIDLVPNTQDWFTKATVRSVDPPCKSRSFAIPRSAAWSYGRPIVARNNHLLGYAPPVTRNGHEEMTVYDAPFRPGAAAKTYRIPAPERALIYSVIFSPSGDRVLWVFRTKNGSAFSRLLHGIVPGIHGLERYRLSVWVSGIDGTQMRDVGLLELTDGSAFGTPPPIQWLPGGKSFMFRDGDAHCWMMRL